MIKQDVDYFNEDALQAYADLKKVPLTKVLRNAGRDFVRKALELTPMLAEVDVWRVWANAPPKGSTIRRNHIWLPDSPHRESLIRAKLAKPLFRGLAKGSWKGAFKALGMSNKTEYEPKSKKAVSSAVWSGDDDGGNVCLTISDFTHYVCDAYLGLNDTIIDKGFEIAAKNIINSWEQALTDYWSGGKYDPDRYF